MTEKDELRRHIRLQKKTYDTAQIASMSAMAIEHLLADDTFRRARTILVYSSMPDEVATDKLLEVFAQGQGRNNADVSTARQASKTILLPTVVGDDLELHVFEGKDHMQCGSFNISESTGRLFTDYDQIDLAVIPGMAFDRMGNRLGRGKGYYDRLLPRLSCPVYGICFPFQLLDSLPVEAHDRRVCKVIS